MKLIADENYRAGLLPLAQALLDEHVSFGTLATSRRLTDTALESYGQRAGATKELLQTLEEVAAVRFAPGIPLLYNGADWSGPPGGYSRGDETDPRPSQLLGTMSAQWYALSRDTPLVARAVRATAYVVLTSGVRTGAEYVFDLLRSGLISLEAGATALLALAAAAADGAGPDAVASELAPGVDRESSTAEWAAVDVPMGVLLGMSGVLVDVAPILEVVVNQCLSEVAALRASRTLDEWWLRQAQVRAVLRPALQLLSASRSPLPLPIKVIESQLEEIQADAGSFVFTAGSHSLDGAELLALQERMITLTAHSDDMDQRLRQQRVARPDAWPDSSSPAPDGWRTVSVGLITPILEFQGPQARAERDFLSARGVEGEEAADRAGTGLPPALQAVMTALKAGDDAQVGELAERGLDDLPWCTPLWWESAIARDRSGDLVGALEAILRALTLTPGDSGLWESFATILRRSDRAEESRFASVMAQVLSSRDAALPDEAGAPDDAQGPDDA